MKSQRYYISCVRAEGLTLVNIEHRSKHDIMIVMNAEGAIYRQTISRGNISDRSRLNISLRANFRRHASADRPHPGRTCARAI